MDGRINYLKNFILENLQHNFTVEELAGKVNISPSYLQQLFKKQMEITPICFIRNLRLERAKKLLEESFLRVKEIRLQVGILEESHFIRDFKQKYDLTPTEYRRQFWKKVEIEELIDGDNSFRRK